MIVRVIDGEEEFSRLWQESSYLAVIPSRENALAVLGEEEAVALEARNLDSQELLPCLGVPHSDIVHAAGGEELRVAGWEDNVVDSLVVAGVSQLWGDVVGVAPVDGGLGGSAEEMGRVSGEGQGCNCSHDLGRLLQLHVAAADLGDGSISGAQQEVSIRQKLDGVDALREQFLGWSNPLEKIVSQ